MAKATYPMPEEVRVSPQEAMSMMQDPSLVVVLATEDEPDVVTVTYWHNERGQLPPWIRPRQAA